MICKKKLISFARSLYYTFFFASFHFTNRENSYRKKTFVVFVRHRVEKRRWQQMYKQAALFLTNTNTNSANTIFFCSAHSVSFFHRRRLFKKRSFLAVYQIYILKFVEMLILFVSKMNIHTHTHFVFMRFHIIMKNKCCNEGLCSYIAKLDHYRLQHKALNRCGVKNLCKIVSF